MRGALRLANLRSSFISTKARAWRGEGGGMSENDVLMKGFHLDRS